MSSHSNEPFIEYGDIDSSVNSVIRFTNKLKKKILMFLKTLNLGLIEFKKILYHAGFQITSAEWQTANSNYQQITTNLLHQALKKIMDKRRELSSRAEEIKTLQQRLTNYGSSSGHNVAGSSQMIGRYNRLITNYNKQMETFKILRNDLLDLEITYMPSAIRKITVNLRAIIRRVKEIVNYSTWSPRKQQKYDAKLNKSLESITSQAFKNLIYAQNESRESNNELLPLINIIRDKLELTDHGHYLRRYLNALLYLIHKIRDLISKYDGQVSFMNENYFSQMKIVKEQFQVLRVISNIRKSERSRLMNQQESLLRIWDSLEPHVTENIKKYLRRILSQNRLHDDDIGYLHDPIKLVSDLLHLPKCHEDDIVSDTSDDDDDDDNDDEDDDSDSSTELIDPYIPSVTIDESSEEEVDMDKLMAVLK